MNNRVVEKIGEMNFKGNIIDNGWFNNLTYENGKPNMVAIIILSDIVYWYKPTEIRNEENGKFLGYKKKFKADKLQRSYESYSNQYGFSKRQVKVAFDYLQSKNIVNIEFRTITVNGQRYNNVMYIEPNPEMLEKISGYNSKNEKTSEGVENTNQRTPSYNRMEEGGVSKEDNMKASNINEKEAPIAYTPSYNRTYPLLHSNVPPLTLECKTYTENTTNNTTENIKSSSANIGKVVKNMQRVGEPCSDDEDEKLNMILEYYCEKAGIRDINLTANDMQCALSLVKKNIPLENIRCGIDLAFNRFKPKFEGDKIRSLSFCAGCISELMAAQNNTGSGKKSDGDVFKAPKTVFNSYDQRRYDIKKLEDVLLHRKEWDMSEIEIKG